MEDHFFDGRLANEADATLSEIAQSAMQQAGRAAAGAEGEIVLVGQERAQPPPRGIARNARTDNSAADHDHVIRHNIAPSSATFSTIKSGGGSAAAACSRVVSPVR